MRVWIRWMAVFLMGLGAAQVAAQTTVEAFSPEGQVKRVRQVTARFSAPMTAFGDPRAASPFEVDCAASGAGRWVDAVTWSYDFAQDLPVALSCRFTLRADAQDLAGQPLGGRRDFAFSTGGPSVVRMLPDEGDNDIDENQVFLLALDAPATPASIARHAWCRAEGINEKIGVRVLAGDERARVLAGKRNFADRQLAQAEKRFGKGDAALTLVALQCRRTLPAGADLALVWGAGVAAPNGVAVAQDRDLAFEVRRDFNVALRCERTNARAGCVPFLPVRAEFSAPVAVGELRRLVLEETVGKAGKAGKADIKRHAPELDDEAKSGFASSVRFTGPFAELSKLRLRLPEGFRDDAGRDLQAPSKRLGLNVDRQPPLVKFAAPFGIIESTGERMLPVTVRNVEPALAATVRSSGASLTIDREQDVMAWLTRLNKQSKDPWYQPEEQGSTLDESIMKGKVDGKVARFTLPKPNGRRAF